MRTGMTRLFYFYQGTKNKTFCLVVKKCFFFLVCYRILKSVHEFFTFLSVVPDRDLEFANAAK